MNKILGPFVTLIFVALTSYAFTVDHNKIKTDVIVEVNQTDGNSSDTIANDLSKGFDAKVAISSELVSYFNSKMYSVLADKGIQLGVTAIDSSDLVEGNNDLSSFDLVLTAGDAEIDGFEKEGIQVSYTSIVFIMWDLYAESLIETDVLKKSDGVNYLDLNKFTNLYRANLKWESVLKEITYGIHLPIGINSNIESGTNIYTMFENYLGEADHLALEKLHSDTMFEFLLDETSYVVSNQMEYPIYLTHESKALSLFDDQRLSFPKRQIVYFKPAMKMSQFAFANNDKGEKIIEVMKSESFKKLIHENHYRTDEKTFLKIGNMVVPELIK